MSLPVNIDATYPDRGAGDVAHQQHHDEIHRIANGFGLVVSSVTDLADYQSGDVITLPAGLVLFVGTVDLGSAHLVISTGTVLRGLSDAVILSTTTGGVVRCSSPASNVIIRELNIVCATGPCLALVGDINYQLNIFFVGLLGAAAGTITGFNVQSIKQCYIDAAEGLVFAGTTRKVFVDSTPFYGITGSAITLDSTLSVVVVDITTTFFKFDSPGVGITAEVGYSVTEGLIRGSLVDGTATPLSGLATSDTNWRMENNSGIRDSRIVGWVYLTSSASTVISAIDTPVKLAGTTAAAALNERISHPASNRVTYTGLVPSLVDISARVNIDPVANNQAFNLYIAKNGTVLPESLTRVRVAAGSDERNADVGVLAEAVTNDFFEVWIENTTSDSDVTALSLTLKITGT